MPEGDTIHRTANRLRPVLADQSLLGFTAPRLTGARPRLGDTIEAVEAVGKNLLIRFPKQLVVQTHMMMTGSWHLYRTEERWQEDAHLARVVIEVEGWTAVCFAAPVVRAWHDTGIESNPLAHLGPDLCVDPVDFDTITSRYATMATGDLTLADALLDQRIAAGIGNVFKSEALWARHLSPFAAADQLGVDQVADLYRTAANQLQANLVTAVRTTVPGGLAVYDRTRRPCLRCHTPIRSTRHGDSDRVTYWCPGCQRL